MSLIDYFTKLWEYISPLFEFLYKYTLSPVFKMLVNIFKFVNTHKMLTIGILILILYLVFSYLLIFKYNYFGYNKFSYITNIIFIVFGVLYGFTLLNNYFSPDEGIQPSLINIVKRISIMLLALFVLFGFIYLIAYFSFLSDTMSLLILVSMTIVGLYFLNKVINNFPFVKKIKQSYLFSILYHILFVIPCLIIDGSVDIYKDLRETPLTIYKILGVQIILIASYFFIPIIMNKIYTHNSKLLLNNPTYLDEETNIGSYESLNPNKLKKNNYKYNYGISFWLFLDNIGENHNNNSNGFMNIINYGDKPKIQFNPKTNSLRITTKDGINGMNIIYETNDLPLQRWNYFVINYDGGNTDIFINNKLVGTKSGIIPYMSFDNVLIGQENGMEGGICNIQYFDKPLTRNYMNFDYSTLKNKTPPII
jgi:hypothetical protein